MTVVSDERVSQSTDSLVATVIPKARWFRIIPPMVVIYVISYMDRMNISFAMAGGMNEAVGISMAVSGFAAGIFFIGYMILQVPGGHIAEHGSAKKFILWTIIAWGGISALTALVQNEWQLLTMRFLLGVAEGGLWPAILVIIGNWFPKKEAGRANALFMSSLAIGSAISSPLSGWLVQAVSWRGMFVVEGVASLAMVFFWFPLITERPQDAAWISQEEKNFLVDTIQNERKKVKGRTKATMSYKALALDVNLWKLNAIYFSLQAGRLGFMIWLPTIIKNLTKQGIAYVGLLSMGPYIAAIIGMYLSGAASDKHLNRQADTVITACGFALFLWLSTLFPGQVWLSYLLLIGTGFFTLSMVPVFWTMPPLLFPTGLTGAALGVFNGIGGFGAFVGSFMYGWIATQFGFNYGMYFLVFLLIFGAGVCMTLPKATRGKA